MMHHCPQAGRKARDLPLPVADHRSRAYDQGGAGLAFAQQEADGLDRLAQTHVISQTGPEPPSAQKGQPGESPHLIGPKLAHKARRGIEGLQLIPLLQGAYQRGQAIVQFDVTDRQSVNVAHGAEGQTQRLSQMQLPLDLMFLPEGNRRFHLVWPQEHPAAAYLHQRRLQCCQTLKLLARQPLIAQGQLPIVSHEGIHAQDAR